MSFANCNCGYTDTTAWGYCVHCGQPFDFEEVTELNIVNLTPHELNLRAANGIMVNVLRSGTVARVSEQRDALPTVAGLSVTRPAYGAVEGLPEPQPDTIYVVSALVLARCAGRNDVFAPGAAIRDDNGKIIGADGLSAAPEVPAWTDEQIRVLVDAEGIATQSMGYGSWVTDALVGRGDGSPLAQAVIEWAERNTPAAPEFDFPEWVQVETRRHVINQTCEVTVRIGDPETGLAGDYREFTGTLRRGDDVSAKIRDIEVQARAWMKEYFPNAE